MGLDAPVIATLLTHHRALVLAFGLWLLLDFVTCLSGPTSRDRGFVALVTWSLRARDDVQTIALLDLPQTLDDRVGLGPCLCGIRPDVDLFFSVDLVRDKILKMGGMIGR